MGGENEVKWLRRVDKKEKSKRYFSKRYFGLSRKFFSRSTVNCRCRLSFRAVYKQSSRDK